MRYIIAKFRSVHETTHEPPAPSADCPLSFPAVSVPSRGSAGENTGRSVSLVSGRAVAGVVGLAEAEAAEEGGQSPRSVSNCACRESRNGR